MSYVINYSGGTITIPLNQANTTGTSLTLIGRNWTNTANSQQGYGQALNQNFVSLLENFANSTQPTSPLKGQFWYDITSGVMKFNNGTPTTPSWATMYSTGASITVINNGTSSVDIPVADGNVNTSVGGVANVLVVTSTGANVAGTLTSNSQIIGTTLRSTINDNATSPLTVASSIKVDNLNSDLLDGYHASDLRNAINTVVVRSASSGVIDNDVNGNITGVFGNITTINSTSLNATTIAGALTTASQPNITSLGTLTTLTSSGPITAPTFTGNLTGNATSAGTVTTASQPNITSVGTLTGITSTGVVNFVGSSNVALGPVGNVRITGGTSGQVLTTNGSGVLTWTTVISGGGSGVANGTSSVTIPTINSNVNITVGGTDRIVATTTGANITGTFNATGNVSGANLTTDGNVLAAGNVLSGNLATTGRVDATNTISGGNLSTPGTLSVVGVSTLGVVNASNITVTGQTRTTNISSGGTTTPGSMTGNWTLTVGSRLQSTYADLAEYYVIDRSAGAGTVVEFGGTAEIRVCNTHMSRAVAGVVSTNPAFIMNESGDHVGQLREAVALQGRVPCKVIGPVSKGDLMVSAGNGAAMACSDPVMGSVIGKSLEDKISAGLAVIEIAVGRL